MALPGGLGALDEVFEVLSLTYLGPHAKPKVLVDAGGAWRTLDSLLRELGRRGFADIGRCARPVVGRSAEAIGMIEAMAPPVAGSMPR